MTEYRYIYPMIQVVPELTSQDPEQPGTLVLQPGCSYNFDGDPPGDPAWWRTDLPPLPPLPPPLPPPAPEPPAPPADPEPEA